MIFGFLIGCGGSGGGAPFADLDGTYNALCRANANAYSLVIVEINGFTRQTTETPYPTSPCSTPSGEPTVTVEQFVVEQSEGDIYLISVPSSGVRQLLKKTSGGIFIDNDPDPVFDPNWDYEADLTKTSYYKVN